MGRLCRSLTVVLGVGVSLTVSCGRNTTQEAGCRLAPDQLKSVLDDAPVRGRLQLRVDARFEEEERVAIRAATGQWNRLVTALGHDALFGDPEVTEFEARVPDCDEGVAPGEVALVRVGPEDAEFWETKEFRAQTLGVTLRCQNSRSARSMRQIVYINHLPRQAKAVERWREGIIAHELGHVAGLRHSCDPDGDSAEYIGCARVRSEFGPEHPYRQALLFPYFYNESQEPRRLLSANDTERACALYAKGDR